MFTVCGGEPRDLSELALLGASRVKHLAPGCSKSLGAHRPAGDLGQLWGPLRGSGAQCFRNLMFPAEVDWPAARPLGLTWGRKGGGGSWNQCWQRAQARCPLLTPSSSRTGPGPGDGSAGAPGRGSPKAEMRDRSLSAHCYPNKLECSLAPLTCVSLPVHTPAFSLSPLRVQRGTPPPCSP